MMAIIAVKMAVSRSAVNSLGIWRESYPLSGHSSGEDTNSIYTHIELPAKREAIRKLEAWGSNNKRSKSTKKVVAMTAQKSAEPAAPKGAASAHAGRKPWRKKTP